jgi:hypothetical protein
MNAKVTKTPIRQVVRVMPHMAVQLTIGDYAKWRPVFDKHNPLRDKAGIKNTQVYRNADDPKEVIVWGETFALWSLTYQPLSQNDAATARGIQWPTLSSRNCELGLLKSPATKKATPRGKKTAVS